MVQHVACCRSLGGVTIQHLEEQALTILTHIDYVFLFARKIAFFVVAEDLISRISTKEIASGQQIKEN